MGWASPETAVHYDRATLRQADWGRADQVRRPKAELDWRVSRALLAAMPSGQDLLSLSHSQGHALCVSARNEVLLGVDLERIVPRDTLGFGRWVCSGSEQQALMDLALDPDRQAEYFYLLWTVKEAFVKAAGLDFPADMGKFGFDGSPASGLNNLRLRSPVGAWWAQAWHLEPDWMAAVVGQGEVPCGFTWYAGPGVHLPERRCLGVWRA